MIRIEILIIGAVYVEFFFDYYVWIWEMINELN